MLSFCFSSMNWAKNFREFGFWYVWLKNNLMMRRMLQNCGYMEQIRYQIQATFLMISSCFSSMNWAKNFREFGFWYVWLKNIHIMTRMLQNCGYIEPMRYQIQVKPTMPLRNRPSNSFKDLDLMKHWDLLPSTKSQFLVF